MDFDPPTIAIIVATFCGPIAAVQAQKWLDRRREATMRKYWVFRTLMMTRATPVSTSHVEALNSIPIEFYSKKTGQGTLMDKWRKYAAHLNTAPDGDSWSVTREHLFTEMLQSISEQLGYDFSYDDLKKVYRPLGQINKENDEDMIRMNLVKLLNGDLHLPLSVKSFSVDGNIIEEQDIIRKLLIAWLEGKASVNVEVKNVDN